MAAHTSAAGSSSVASPWSDDADVVDHDRGALAGQRQRELTAEAPTRSRHHGHPAVQQAAFRLLTTLDPLD